eukprot:4381358-Pyramimonas_sp.AAC.1
MITPVHLLLTTYGQLALNSEPVATSPVDWCVRLPGKRAGPHYQRIQHLMSKARALRMTIAFVGPLGYFWKQGPLRGAIEDLGCQVRRMRFCHFGL